MKGIFKYKCRMCGWIFDEIEEYGSLEDLTRELVMASHNLNFSGSGAYIRQPPPENVIHQCGPKCFGIADIIGIELSDER